MLENVSSNAAMNPARALRTSFPILKMQGMMSADKITDGKRTANGETPRILMLIAICQRNSGGLCSHVSQYIQLPELSGKYVVSYNFGVSQCCVKLRAT